jgi:hypothetical protein
MQREPQLRRRPAWLPVALAGALLGLPAAAQCGPQWAPFGSVLSSPIRLVLTPGGTAVLAENARVRQWDGTTWVQLGTGTFGALDLLPHGSGLLAAGRFTWGTPPNPTGLALWNGTTWQPFASSTDGSVAALARMPNGDIVAGGLFSSFGGTPAASIARWDGGAWHPLGSGVNSLVHSLLVRPDGDLIVGGQFSTAGGVLSPGIARWDGSSWHALGGGLSIPNFPPSAWTLANHPDGSLLVGGEFGGAGGTPVANVARWDGSSWSALGAGLGPVAFVISSVRALHVLPDGSVLAGGRFTTSGGTPLRNVARWDGVNWTEVPGPDLPARCFLTLPDDTVLVGGDFTLIGTQIAGRIARLDTTCRALAVPAGGGCPSSGGSNTLTVERLPWVGATFRTRGTGLPAAALVAAVFGFQATSIPLASVVPQGQPGCVARASLDYVAFPAATAGSAIAELTLPTSPWLIGQVLHHQMIPLELDAQANLLSVTATNAFSLTIGSW